MNVNLGFTIGTGRTLGSCAVDESGVGTNQLINKLRQQVHKILVLGLLIVDLAHELRVLALDVIELLLRLLLFAFVLKDAALQELRQIILAELVVFVVLDGHDRRCFTGRRGRSANLHISLGQLLLEHLDLRLVLGDDALAEVRALGQLILNFSVLLELDLQKFDLGAHLLILIRQLLNVLTLIVKLAGKLYVLFLRELGSALEIFLVHRQHLDFYVANREQHFFA